MERMFLCFTYDLQVNTSRQFILPGGKSIALFRTHNAYHAIENRCPHAGAPLHKGIIRADTLMCIWHGWKFNLKTGVCLSRDNARLRQIPVAIEDQKIYLQHYTDTKNLE